MVVSSPSNFTLSFVLDSDDYICVREAMQLRRDIGHALFDTSLNPESAILSAIARQIDDYFGIASELTDPDEFLEDDSTACLVDGYRRWVARSPVAPLSTCFKLEFDISGHDKEALDRGLETASRFVGRYIRFNNYETTSDSMDSGRVSLADMCRLYIVLMTDGGLWDRLPSGRWYHAEHVEDCLRRHFLGPEEQLDFDVTSSFVAEHSPSKANQPLHERVHHRVKSAADAIVGRTAEAERSKTIPFGGWYEYDCFTLDILKADGLFDELVATVTANDSECDKDGIGLEFLPDGAAFERYMIKNKEERGIANGFIDAVDQEMSDRGFERVRHTRLLGGHGFWRADTRWLLL